ncbi:coronin-2B isoform X2 [Diabrotica virgifera virgifera]|uniref:Coronin n=1 Tax=Diabrotica virgifera virgifera TaxID=50390 RepID=A0ABM5KAQ2_DIAVI|nr:coronin-2B isoform X2 [Diabrotica virgifera virgifera]XP_050507264.1 coronin-2B isoform X2 [Diabrotica virgifera virgifera]XP_050507265.1 coronin-2B isoform X2 [Diabrotica virgifera virgifera]
MGIPTESGMLQSSQLWFKGVRSSKFRHVYGEPAKREKCYDNIPITKNAHDSQFCAVNPKFVAVVTEVAGGGAFIVIPINCTGRLDFNASKVTGHSGPILDIKWNPFNDNVIASCSDDCTIKLWHIPDEGLSVHLTDWLVELQGHKRRVGYIEWHPTAENILFSAGFDYLVIVWDIEKGEAINVIDCHHDAIHSMSLNRDGSLLATTCKDKKLRIIEPRSGIVKTEGICHAGSKASKVVYLGSTGQLLTTGFSRHSDRQYSVWDESDLSQPLFTDSIDSSSGVVFPFFDADTNMVYLAGKGDGNIRYYEVTDEAPYVHYLSQILSGNPQRGLGFMPKRGLRTAQCEVFRFYKLHATKGLCEPISMIVPRKSDQFHEDLYPDTAAPKPALSAQEWIRGKNAMPLLISMKTGEQNELNITSIKQRNLIKTVAEPSKVDNNKKKLAFLATETIIDYRPKDNVITEKSRKTTNNQTFQKLQQKFSQIEINNHKDVRLIKEVNSFGDNIMTENDLRRAYQSQGEEIRKLKKQLINSEQRVKELEEQLKRLLKK